VNDRTVRRVCRWPSFLPFNGGRGESDVAGRSPSSRLWLASLSIEYLGEDRLNASLGCFEILQRDEELPSRLNRMSTEIQYRTDVVHV
jgi:hypothetical protein